MQLAYANYLYLEDKETSKYAKQRIYHYFFVIKESIF